MDHALFMENVSRGMLKPLNTRLINSGFVMTDEKNQ